MNNEEYNIVKRIILSQLRRSDIFIDVNDLIADVLSCMVTPYERGHFLHSASICLIEKRREHFYKDKFVDKYLTEKTCTRCNKILPISFFGITKVYRYNGEYYNSHCKSCACQVFK